MASWSQPRSLSKVNTTPETHPAPFEQEENLARARSVLQQTAWPPPTPTEAQQLRFTNSLRSEMKSCSVCTQIRLLTVPDLQKERMSRGTTCSADRNNFCSESRSASTLQERSRGSVCQTLYSTGLNSYWRGCWTENFSLAPAKSGTIARSCSWTSRTIVKCTCGRHSNTIRIARSACVTGSFCGQPPLMSESIQAEQLCSEWLSTHMTDDVQQHELFQDGDQTSRINISSDD